MQQWTLYVYSILGIEFSVSTCLHCLNEFFFSPEKQKKTKMQLWTTNYEWINKHGAQYSAECTCIRLLIHFHAASLMRNTRWKTGGQGNTYCKQTRTTKTFHWHFSTGDVIETENRRTWMLLSSGTEMSQERDEWKGTFRKWNAMKMKRACQKHSNHFDWKLPFCSSNSEIINSCCCISYNLFIIFFFLFAFYLDVFVCVAEPTNVYSIVFQGKWWASLLKHQRSQYEMCTVHSIHVPAFTLAISDLYVYIIFHMLIALIRDIRIRIVHNYQNILKAKRSRIYEQYNAIRITKCITMNASTKCIFQIIWLFFLFVLLFALRRDPKRISRHLTFFSFGEWNFCFYDYDFYVIKMSFVFAFLLLPLFRT